MKYISPKYEIVQCKANDIVTVSLTFSIFEDETNDKVEYIVAPEGVFGF